MIKGLSLRQLCLKAAFGLTSPKYRTYFRNPKPNGGIAQLVERYNGIVEAIGSNPFTSTQTRSQQWLRVFCFPTCALL